ncbi:MAG: neuromedin U, partial [Chlorobiota bacterium]
PGARTQYVLNIQPVIPSFNGRLITRTIFPFVWDPDY